jgi:hypothetical protein
LERLEGCVSNGENKELPTHLYYHETRVEMTVFIPGVKNSYNCEKIGHIKKVCQEAEHVWDCSPKCVNCKGKYTAFSQRCPLIIREIG